MGSNPIQVTRSRSQYPPRKIIKTRWFTFEVLFPSLNKPAAAGNKEWRGPVLGETRLTGCVMPPVHYTLIWHLRQIGCVACLSSKKQVGSNPPSVTRQTSTRRYQGIGESKCGGRPTDRPYEKFVRYRVMMLAILLVFLALRLGLLRGRQTTIRVYKNSAIKNLTESRARERIIV